MYLSQDYLTSYATMPKLSTVLPLSVVVLLLAASYQIVLRDIIFVTGGLGRHVQTIAEFPFKCRRLTDPVLHACEDMWLEEKSRQLFLACSDSLARKEWMPK